MSECSCFFAQLELELELWRVRRFFLWQMNASVAQGSRLRCQNMMPISAFERAVLLPVVACAA